MARLPHISAAQKAQIVALGEKLHQTIEDGKGILQELSVVTYRNKKLPKHPDPLNPDKEDIATATGEYEHRYGNVACSLQSSAGFLKGDLGELNDTEFMRELKEVAQWNNDKCSTGETNPKVLLRSITALEKVCAENSDKLSADEKDIIKTNVPKFRDNIAQLKKLSTQSKRLYNTIAPEGAKLG